MSSANTPDETVWTLKLYSIIYVFELKWHALLTVLVYVAYDIKRDQLDILNRNYYYQEHC